MTSPRIPLTVLGGYLGAGKTTLLNEILVGDHGRRLAVIVNDFGDVSIDEHLLESSDGGLRALANGCVCCQAVDGLATALEEIAALDPRPEHLLIEASGVSDPWKIAQWGRTPGYALDSVVVLVDPGEIESWVLDPYVGDTVIGQLAAADLLVLSHGDVTAPDELVRLTTWLSGYSPAEVLVGPNVPLEFLIGRPAIGAPHREHAEHSALTFTPRRLSRGEVEAWIAAAPRDVVRAKGFAATDEDLLIVQRVGRRVEVIRADAAVAPMITVIARTPAFSPAVSDWIRTIAVDPLSAQSPASFQGP